jgi:hypothetical protein
MDRLAVTQPFNQCRPQGAQLTLSPAWAAMSVIGTCEARPAPVLLALDYVGSANHG